MSFGFLVATFIEKECHKHALEKCLSSIRQFHQEKIVVIVNASSRIDFLTEIMIKYTDNILFELNTESNIPADMQLYKLWYLNKYFDKAVTLQDSMYLKEKIPFDKTTDINFLWHFTNHRVQWHTILEPNTDYNVHNNIKTHDDLILHTINTRIINSEFKTYILDMYPQKNKWVGCFGFMTCMTYKFLCKLQEKTSIFEVMHYTTTNRLRRVMESIFALACQYTLNHEIHSSLDGLYYDGLSYHNGFKGKYIGKQSYDRD